MRLRAGRILLQSFRAAYGHYRATLLTQHTPLFETLALHMKRIAITLFLLSISGTVMADEFTYNFQMAGYDFNHYDEKGSTDYENFVNEFQSFPWKSQAGQSNGGSEATISVKNISNSTGLWVSVIGDSSEYAHLVGVVYEKEVRGIFGLGKPRIVRWLEIFVAEEPSTVEQLFLIFFDGNHSGLMSELSKLPKFSEMEAQN